MFLRGNVLTLDGDQTAVEAGVAVVRELSELIRQGHEIAIVLTDMAMPVMDGPSTVVALKVMNPKVRLIGSSGQAGEMPSLWMISSKSRARKRNSAAP